MNAVIYCRVSSHEQIENFSLPTQKAECERFCIQNGWSVVSIFTEAGRSAKDTERRPEFQRMKEFCQRNRGTVTAIVVYNISRFSRDMTSGAAAICEFRQLGIRVVSVTEAVDDTPAGKLAQNIFLSFAQFDNDQRSERTTLGMEAALARGKWTHNAPLGYQWTKVGLRPDPEMTCLAFFGPAEA